MYIPVRILQLNIHLRVVQCFAADDADTGCCKFSSMKPIAVASAAHHFFNTLVSTLVSSLTTRAHADSYFIQMGCNRLITDRIRCGCRMIYADRLPGKWLR